MTSGHIEITILWTKCTTLHFLYVYFDLGTSDYRFSLSVTAVTVGVEH